MSWLRDPETGDMAKPIDEAELKRLEKLAGRQRQRRHWRWVVKRDKDGTPQSADLRPIPKDEIGI